MFNRLLCWVLGHKKTTELLDGGPYGPQIHRTTCLRSGCKFSDDSDYPPKPRA